MIVKTVSNKMTKHVDCVSATVVPDTEGPDGKQSSGVCIIFDFGNGRDATYVLSVGEKIFYLNDSGRTIDKDFRMCG